MKSTVTVILLFLSINSFAAFSKFVHVSPETEDKYKFKVEVVQNDSNEDIYDIRFKSRFLNLYRPSSQHAWLVIASRSLTNEEQRFRSMLWNSTKESKDIILMNRLMPDVEHKFDDEAKMFKMTFHGFKLTLHRDLIKHAYIYIDYPDSVMDGGYYYSIDLSQYINQE